MTALFDKIAKRFWTHAVRPEGARIAHRRSESILVLAAERWPREQGPLCLAGGL